MAKTHSRLSPPCLCASVRGPDPHSKTGHPLSRAERDRPPKAARRVSAAARINPLNPPCEPAKPAKRLPPESAQFALFSLEIHPDSATKPTRGAAQLQTIALL